MKNPPTIRVRPEIGSRFCPGVVYRNPADGTYYECMPNELGSEGARIQKLLLARDPVKFPWLQGIIKLYSWVQPRVTSLSWKGRP